MTDKYQDKILINDIIDRNYYWNFIRNDSKDLCLTFFYNNKFNNSNLIPGFPIPQTDSEKILFHLKLLLNWYVKNKFRCNIKINDELWLSDTAVREEIINIFIDTFKDIDRDKKPAKITIICNAIYILGEKSEWFKTVQERFNEIGIDLILNIETMLIDIVDVRYLFEIQDFLLSHVNKLKIRINPNNFVYFTEVFEDLYNTFKDILYLYEEDNVNWTDYKIDEYIEFLNKYIDFMYKENQNNELLFLQSLFNGRIDLISLKDNGTLDNSHARCNCSFYQSLNILLEDLTINLCPKFQYDDQIIGQYIYDDTGIIEIEPKYIGLISMNVHLKKSSTPHCENCPFVIFCHGFCCKESYKYCLNPIIPLLESCEMKKSKYAFLFYKLKHLNIFNRENLEKLEISPFYLNYILLLCDNITGGIKE